MPHARELNVTFTLASMPFEITIIHLTTAVTHRTPRRASSAAGVDAARPRSVPPSRAFHRGRGSPGDARMGLAKHGCQLGAAYVVLYFGILGLSPAAFDLYMKQFRNMEGPEDLSLEPQITNAREVFGVHDYDEVVNISSGMDEVIIFRNFSDCRRKFETSLLPRRKDQYDTYRLITPTNHTGNVYVTGYTKGGTISKTLGETIADESPTYYASFLRLFDKHDYAELPGTGQDKRDSTSLQRERSARARSGKSIHASRPSREMIARPKISRNEWKTAERGAFEVGHVALLCCPGSR